MHFTVGKRIQELREAAGLSGRKLAGFADISPSFLSELENNLTNPTMGTVTKLCKALGITLADFFAPAGRGAEPLPPELRRLLDSARELSPEDLAAVQQILDTMGRSRPVGSEKSEP